MFVNMVPARFASAGDENGLPLDAVIGDGCDLCETPVGPLAQPLSGRHHIVYNDAIKLPILT